MGAPADGGMGRVGGGQKEERSIHAKTLIRVFCPFVSVSR